MIERPRPDDDVDRPGRQAGGEDGQGGPRGHGEGLVARRRPVLQPPPPPGRRHRSRAGPGRRAEAIGSQGAPGCSRSREDGGPRTAPGVPPTWPTGPIPVHVACVMDGNGRWAGPPGPAPHRGARGRRGGPARRGEGCARPRHPLDHHVRLLHRELAPAGRRGPLPDGLQREPADASPRRAERRRASASASPAGATGGCPSGCCGAWTSRSS